MDGRHGGVLRWGVREQLVGFQFGVLPWILVCVLSQSQDVGLGVREFDDGSDQGDEVMCVDSVPALLGGQEALEGHG